MLAGRELDALGVVSHDFFMYIIFSKGKSKKWIPFPKSEKSDIGVIPCSCPFLNCLSSSSDFFSFRLRVTRQDSPTKMSGHHARAKSEAGP